MPSGRAVGLAVGPVHDSRSSVGRDVFDTFEAIAVIVNAVDFRNRFTVSSIEGPSFRAYVVFTSRMTRRAIQRVSERPCVPDEGDGTRVSLASTSGPEVAVFRSCCTGRAR